jgi:hypothetical protein
MTTYIYDIFYDYIYYDIFYDYIYYDIFYDYIWWYILWLWWLYDYNLLRNCNNELTYKTIRLYTCNIGAENHC